VKVRMSVIVTAAMGLGGNHAETLYYNITAVHRRSLHQALPRIAACHGEDAAGADEKGAQTRVIRPLALGSLGQPVSARR
jgi:hypothetical protein